MLFKKKNKDLDIIKKSVLFDEKWYKNQHPDIKIKASKHYLEIGWLKGFNPSQLFDGNEYLKKYPDVKEANINPLLHYELYGKKENRSFFSQTPSLPPKPKKQYFSSIRESIPNINTVKKYIKQDSVDIVSFDIFDTLVFRPVVNPTDVFYLIHEKLKNEHDIDFLKYRLNAESELGNYLANLDEIYEFIQNKYQLSTETISLMKNEEISCEKRLCTKRDDLFELYEFAIKHNKKVVAISDMYLSSKVLKEILYKNGYDKISKVYVSNECKCRKDTTKLYEYVKQSENNARIIHIGDNFESDYKKAIESNIQAIYYPSIKDIILRENSIFNTVWFTPELSPDPMCRILLGYTLTNNFKNISKVNSYSSIYSNFNDFVKLSIAPVIFYISTKIGNNKEIQNKYKNIYYASRDGFLPSIGYSIYSKYKKCIPHKYFYAGRRAYFSTQNESFIDYINKYERTDDSPFTLSNLLKVFINDSKLVNNLKNKLTKEELNQNFKTDKQEVLETLSRFESELDTYLNKHKNESSKYYKDLFKNDKNIIVFDCGYSGSISTAIGKIINKKVDKIYLWEFDANKELDKKNKTKTYLLMNEPALFFTQNLVYEEIFSPLDGGCLGFKNGAPIIEDLFANSEMKSKYNILQTEVQNFMEGICQKFQPYLNYINLFDTCALQRIMNVAFASSPFNEIELLENICFPDPIAYNQNYSLSYKVQQCFVYDNPYEMTGYNNPNNIITQTSSEIIKNNLKIGIHIHLYNIFLYQEFVEYLKDFPQKFDLIITICDKEKLSLIKDMFSKEILPNMDNIIVKVLENRGRDIAPWIVGTKEYQSNYDLFCHVQSKVSSHFNFGNRWRKYLVKNLLDKNSFTNIINLFISNEKLGCIFPESFKELKDLCTNGNINLAGIEGEILIINSLLEKMNFTRKLTRADLFFSAGTMMWYRPKAMHQLFELDLDLSDFPPEPIGTGGTIAHAIERLPAFICKLNNFEAKEFTNYKN